jgi:hypothetical protein
MPILDIDRAIDRAPKCEELRVIWSQPDTQSQLEPLR